MIVSWGSSDVIIQSNYIHHQLDWLHPDGIQLYRHVSNVRIIDNVIAANTQGLHIQEADNVLLKGNLIYGSSGYLVSTWATNSRLENNTLAFSGYGLLRLPDGLKVNNNVFFVGHSKPAYSTLEAESYEADTNVYWNTSRATNSIILRTEAGWIRDWNQLLLTGMQDKHSVYADPGFANAPIAFDSLNTKTSSITELVVNTHANLFRLGDIVEVNFDGIPRRIVSKTGATIKVEPALTSLPRTALIANWGANSNLKLDFRRDGSAPIPTAGSLLDIGSFINRSYGVALTSGENFTLLRERAFEALLLDLALESSPAAGAVNELATAAVREVPPAQSPAETVSDAEQVTIELELAQQLADATAVLEE